MADEWRSGPASFLQLPAGTAKHRLLVLRAPLQFSAWFCHHKALLQTASAEFICVALADLLKESVLRTVISKCIYRYLVM